MGFVINSISSANSWNSGNSEINEDGNRVVYSIHGGGEHLIMPISFYEKGPSSEFQNMEYLINGLIKNNKWPKMVKIDSDNDLKTALLQFNIPKTPQEKLDNLFLNLFAHQKVDGISFRFLLGFDNSIANTSYFKSAEEVAFYLKTLEDKNLISFKKNSIGVPSLGIPQKPISFEVSITFDGFDYYNKITNEGMKSKNCFIAMSFSPDMIPIRIAIKSSCIQTGFTPILIDEVHSESDRTINDEIIANIKKSKFCISDFTKQSDGVYFEAGYALGRGLKLIYTCQEDDMIKTHFDTKHFSHILYTDEKDLEKKLINKIEAWIID